MSAKLKLYLGRKVLESLFVSHKDIDPVQLKKLIEIGTPRSEKSVEMNICLNSLETILGVSSVNKSLKIHPDDIIQNIQYRKENTNRQISFEINRNLFVKDVIEYCSIPEVNLEPQNVVIEYSSPNVAKPFHFAHLRSTMIGNFIANLHAHHGNKVTRLNYLGDWGTQFGYVKVGVDKLNYSEEQIKNDPMKLLYESYVFANKLAQKDPNVLELAKSKFSNLENGSPLELQNWKTYVNYTIQELKNTYYRLGVTFDEYHCESMYSVKQIESLISILKDNNLLQLQNDGRQTISVNNSNITLIKSDGSTLYLTRDIAAAIDRYEKYKFDRMYYIVENGQHAHFNTLKEILQKMKYSWANKIHHVKFGRIHGMSTRKGTAVFLKDILDETKELTIKRQIASPNTKVPITDNHISDALGISCVIVNDLKQRRQKDYEFSWDRILQVKGESGIKLQYAHCRLLSLEKNCGVQPAQVCKPELLDQSEVTTLVRELARFQEVLYHSQQQLEACILANYLFNLCNYINRALKTLRVKDQESELASQRLLLFHRARIILGQGMSILGIKPLEQM